MTLPELLPILFSGGIFIVGFLALLLAGINALLSPIKKDIRRLDKRMDKLEVKLTQFESKLDQIIAIQKNGLSAKDRA